MLGLSIDEADALEDVELGTVNGIPFIAEEDFVSQHGESYSITLVDGGLVLISGL